MTVPLEEMSCQKQQVKQGQEQETLQKGFGENAASTGGLFWQTGRMLEPLEIKY